MTKLGLRDKSGIMLYALRHGYELRDVQQMLGHVSISTTQVYRRIANNGVASETTVSND